MAQLEPHFLKVLTTVLLRATYLRPYESVITCDGSDIAYLDLTGTS